MPRLITEPKFNADFAWDEFDPDWYAKHNYDTLLEDDREILSRVRDFFTDVLDGRRLPRGIDVGAGANLYPSLAMLPFCSEITLSERGAANRRWLDEQIKGPAGYGRSWDAFWHLLSEKQPYRELPDPRRALRDRARIQHGDVFKLGRRQWDLGTMFFVAESLTAREREFRIAAHRFVNSLRIDAPFAAAFMRNSLGYTVATQRFPAVAVNEVDVEHCLSEVAQLLEVVPIRLVTQRRDGYDGMVLALGRARRTKT